MEHIIKLLEDMSLEELLDTFAKSKELFGVAESSLLRLLIEMELDKRING